MNSVTPIKEPNYTQIPNVILDTYWPSMGAAEKDVVIQVCRQTFGWHKDENELSLSRLMQLTGLSRQGVINGIEAAMKRGILGRRESGNSYVYFVIVNVVDQSTELTIDSQYSRPGTVNAVDTQNKDKESKTKESAARRRKPSQPTATTLLNSVDIYNAICIAVFEVDPLDKVALNGKAGLAGRFRQKLANTLSNDPQYTPEIVAGLVTEFGKWYHDKYPDPRFKLHDPDRFTAHFVEFLAGRQARRGGSQWDSSMEERMRMEQRDASQNSR